MILKTDDGQRSAPFAPTQIASTGGLSLKSERIGGWAHEGNHQGNGPVWVAVGSQGPGRLPGNGGAMGSQTGGAATGFQAQIKTGAEPADNPLLTVLKSKVPPRKRPPKSSPACCTFCPFLQKTRPAERVLGPRGSP